MATTNMGLTTSTPLVTTGPAWANNVESNWDVLDAHDHSSGKGVQITPSGININTNLEYNSFSAIGLQSTRYNNQSAVLSSSIVTTVYAKDGNLYFNNGTGNAVQVTNGTSVNVAGVGGITGLGGTDAAVTYSDITKVFAFTQDANITASLDVGPVTIRENIAFANGITLQSPSSLAGSYSMTMPAALPASPALMQLSAAGLVGVSLTTSGNADKVAKVNSAGTAFELSTVDTAGITNLAVTDAKLAANAVTTSKVLDAAITKPKLAALGHQVSASCGSFTSTSTTFVDVTNLTVTITTTGRPVRIYLVPADSTGVGHIAIVPGNQTVAEVDVMLQKNSSDLFRTRFGAFDTFGSTRPDAIYVPSGMIEFLDEPAAGTYTYKIQQKVNNSLNTSVWQTMKLVAYEL